MFNGNMVTEAIPARVFALYNAVSRQGSIARSDLQKMLEPENISGNTSYFSPILNTAVELRLVEVKENTVKSIVDRKELKNMNDLRRITTKMINSFESEQFFRVTRALLGMDEKVYAYTSISDGDMIRYLSDKLKQTITAPMIRGWRFWAQFIGIGYMHDMSFLPNAYVFAKDVISLMELEVNEEMTMDDFMISFNKYGKIATDSLKGDYTINMALSNGLRQLHDNDELRLIYKNDQPSRWALYPSKQAFNKPVTSVLYKGI